jgi:uncharacterized coiled-coil protein SlyX
MEITIPVTLLISLATFLVTVGGTWFVTQRRIRELENKVAKQDIKHDQILLEINGIKVEINGHKIEIDKIQTSITAMNEKLDLIIQGRIKSN